MNWRLTQKFPTITSITDFNWFRISLHNINCSYNLTWNIPISKHFDNLQSRTNAPQIKLARELCPHVHFSCQLIGDMRSSSIYDTDFPQTGGQYFTVKCVYSETPKSDLEHARVFKVHVYSPEERKVLQQSWEWPLGSPGGNELWRTRSEGPHLGRKQPPPAPLSPHLAVNSVTSCSGGVLPWVQRCLLSVSVNVWVCPCTCMWWGERERTPLQPPRLPLNEVSVG